MISGNELLTGYKQPVNNLLITSIIAQNAQKRASKNRTTTTSAQMRKRYCSEKGSQGYLFSPLNPHFPISYFVINIILIPVKKSNIYKRDRGIESIKGPYKKNL